MGRIWLAFSPLTKGIVCMVTALLFFTIMDAIAKELTTRYHPIQVVWARYASQTFWSFLGFAPFLHRVLRSHHLGIQLLRSTLLFSATICFFISLKYLKLAETTAIFEVAPLFITVLSVLILKERVGPRRLLAVVCGLLGALIIIRPGSEAFTVYAIFPVMAAFCFAAYAIATRFLSADEGPATSFLYTALIGSIFASFVVIPFWQPIASADIWIMATFGMLGGCGHFLLILAFRGVQASVLAPFSYFSLLYSVIWGILFFSEYPDMMTILGSVFIIGSGLYVWYRERRVKHKET